MISLTSRFIAHIFAVQGAITIVAYGLAAAYRLYILDPLVSSQVLVLTDRRLGHIYSISFREGKIGGVWWSPRGH